MLFTRWCLTLPPVHMPDPAIITDVPRRRLMALDSFAVRVIFSFRSSNGERFRPTRLDISSSNSSG